jgi:hypothetical protein
VTIKSVPQQILFPGFGGRKAPSSMGEMSTSGFPRLLSGQALRLRATSAVSRDKSVRRSAQDDDFVWELDEKNILKLALLGKPHHFSAHSHGKPGQVGERGHPSR